MSHGPAASPASFLEPPLHGAGAGPDGAVGASTSCVRSGTVKDPVCFGITSPIFVASSSRYPNAINTAVYPRFHTHPNQHAVVAKIAALERGAVGGLVFASGMAAISTTLYALLLAGDHALFHTALYGGTASLVATDLHKRGVSHTLVTGSDVKSFDAALAQANAERKAKGVGANGVKLVYVESPSNPLVQILDLKAIGAWAKRHGLVAVVDNTFATPLAQTPIADAGFDVVIHSATKYLNGHSDMNAGVVVSRHASIVEQMHAVQLVHGGTLNPMDCYSLERGLKTLALRFRTACYNAQKLAEYFASPRNTPARVKAVHYPGLPHHPGHAVARKQMAPGLYGAMIAVEFNTDGDTAHAVVKALRVTDLAVSLGGVESTACFPAETSHAPLTAAQRAAMGISDTLLRISVGIEDADDMIADWDRALSRIAPPTPGHPLVLPPHALAVAAGAAAGAGAGAKPRSKL